MEIIFENLYCFLVILFVIIVYAHLLNTYKAELALCFHLIPELVRQVFISVFPDHHHKSEECFDLSVTSNLESSLWRNHYTNYCISLILIHFELITLNVVVDNLLLNSIIT